MTCCCCFGTSNKQGAANLYSRSVGGFSSEKNVELFSYSKLRSATNNFNRSNKIGQGGFGTVYKVLTVSLGLAFLHEELASPIVHRDIKASNILLDRNYSPKIGDFGLAKLFPDDITHISTRVAGTTGYLAPEYAWYGQLTKKADVYSFGVLVLETVSGKSSSRSLMSEDKVLLEKAWELYEAGRLKEMIDPALQEEDGEGIHPEAEAEAELEEEAIQYMKVALLCTQAAALRRPSMQQVAEMLSRRRGIRVNERELTAPGYIHDYKRTFLNVVKPITSSSAAASRSQGSSSTDNYTIIMPTVSEMSPR